MAEQCMNCWFDLMRVSVVELERQWRAPQEFKKLGIAEVTQKDDIAREKWEGGGLGEALGTQRSMGWKLVLNNCRFTPVFKKLTISVCK